MDHTIVFVSGFSGYENGMNSAIDQLRDRRRGDASDNSLMFKVIDFSTPDDLYAQVFDAWHHDSIPVVQTSIESIKDLSDTFPEGTTTRILFAPDSCDTYYNELLSKTEFSDDDIDRIIGKAENECDRVWLYDRIITDGHKGLDASSFFLQDSSDLIPANTFDVLGFKENLSSILYKRRYDRVMNTQIHAYQNNEEPG